MAIFHLELQRAVLKQILIAVIFSPKSLCITQPESNFKWEIVRKLTINITIYTADFTFYRAVVKCKYLIHQTFINASQFFSSHSISIFLKKQKQKHFSSPHSSWTCQSTALQLPLELKFWLHHHKASRAASSHGMMKHSFKEVYLNQNIHKF